MIECTLKVNLRDGTLLIVLTLVRVPRTKVVWKLICVQGVPQQHLKI